MASAVFRSSFNLMNSPFASRSAQTHENSRKHPFPLGSTCPSRNPAPSTPSFAAPFASLSPLGPLHFASPSSPAYKPFNSALVSTFKARRNLSSLPERLRSRGSAEARWMVEGGQHAGQGEQYHGHQPKQPHPATRHNRHNPSFVAFHTGYETSPPRRIDDHSNEAASPPPYSQKHQRGAKELETVDLYGSRSLEERRRGWEREERKKMRGE